MKTGQLARQPVSAPVRFDGLQRLLDEANQAIGRLDGVVSALPDPLLIAQAYIRKEGLLSAQMDGARATLTDLLLFEMGKTPGVPRSEVQRAANYAAAMEHGLKRVRAGFPLSLRRIRKIHEILHSNGRRPKPGEFRRGAKIVLDRMHSLETFLYDDRPDVPQLVKAGLVLAQLELIHPFPAGNGALGRLLTSLLLCAQDERREPILYLSLHFKAHREEYGKLLQRAGAKGAKSGLGAWLTFFLIAVKDTAEQAAKSARRIVALFDRHLRKIERLGRPAHSTAQVFQYVKRNPIVSIPAAARKTGISAPTVAKAVEHMIELGILREMTGRARHRLFVYEPYLAILGEGA